MLLSLSIENYALIESLSMTLGGGLNTITGETGAGKSILLGALGLLLGTRGEAGVQRDATRNCVVEGLFELEGQGLEAFFAAADLEYADQTTIRRVVLPSGKSRAYVGDLPVSMATLRELGERLIDIHSQHQNLLLQGEGFRISILDGAAGQNAALKRYGELFARLKDLSRELFDAQNQAAEARRDEDYIRHQAAELAAMRLVAGEETLLETEGLELSHADDIRDAMSLTASELGADETGIVARLRMLKQTTARIAEIQPRAAEVTERLTSIVLELQDIERDATAECERIEGNPERLAAVTERLDAIYALQQKHRVGSVAELSEVLADFEQRLAVIEGGDERVAEIEAALAATKAEVEGQAALLSRGRLGVAEQVSDATTSMLRRLGMPEARFSIEVSSTQELRASGGDEVRFLFSANNSVAPRPIEKIASGGEISRVMLALKALSARSARRPTVIFDEIDAGVSGRVADAMGDIIAELGHHCQVVNITHLPQIAAKEGSHFVVYKTGGATHISELNPDERTHEIAKMLSGSTITEAAMKQAAELLGVR